MPIPLHTCLAHYEILSPIGAGELGEVYRANDTRLDRPVALKLLPAELTRDDERVRRFLREAKAASALNHPNIITVYDLGESEAGRFIVMELVEGRTLRALIAEDNSAAVLSLGAQIAKALAAAHAVGITHRDVKPDKIMVRDDGYVKILDFGLARLAQGESGEEEITLGQRGQTDKLLAIVRYMSPEQARGMSAGHPSDVFSLGLIFYELATGQHPFAAASARGLRALLDAIITDAPTPPAQLNSQLPAELESLILWMLHKEAHLRPTAAEVEAALLEIGDRARATAGLDKGTAELWPRLLDAPPTADESDGLDLAHVLFCDIVGYSLLPIDRQTETMRTLQELVRQTDVYRRAEAARHLVRLPAGDGMALAFLQDPTAPVRCAFDLARALRDYPDIQLRMGVHSGPVFRSTDININRNVVGEGINMAQRVMNCGDAGHILVSRQVARILRLISRWEPYLHDLGVHEVKHGLRLHLYNLYDRELGNPAVPSKLRAGAPAPMHSAELSSGQDEPIAWPLRPAAAPLDPASSPIQAITPPGVADTQKFAVASPAVSVTSPRRSPLRAGLFAFPVLALLLAAGWLGWKALRADPSPEWDLTYSLVVQRMRDGQPYREAFEATGREMFEDGWKFRFQVYSPRPGYLYLINEGPVAKGAIGYRLLFGGAAPMAAGAPLQTGWQVIGNVPGVERIFLVWSKTAVSELDAGTNGDIVEGARLDAVRQFLNRHADSKPAIEAGSSRKQTRLRSRKDLFVHTIELEHP